MNLFFQESYTSQVEIKSQIIQLNMKPNLKNNWD